MSSSLDHAARTTLARLAPYARRTVELAADDALHMHAEELAAEHVLVSLLRDEDAGATRMVLHAFADPATLAVEVLALCPGILVVSSGRTLPFSVRSVTAARAAHAHSSTSGTSVGTGDLLGAAWDELEDEARARLERAGADAARARSTRTQDRPPPGGGSEASLFHVFSSDARRALGAACRLAGSLGRTSIAPAHLLMGCLEVEPALGESFGLASTRAHGLLAGHDEDRLPPPTRALRMEAELSAHLERLPDGADTVDLLGEVLARGREEVRALLASQKVTWAFYQSSRGGFDDPEEDERGVRGAPPL